MAGQEEKMITKHENNPLIGPGDVRPSAEGYKVLGSFNPGAVNFGDEIVLLVPLRRIDRNDIPVLQPAEYPGFAVAVRRYLDHNQPVPQIPFTGKKYA